MSPKETDEPVTRSFLHQSEFLGWIRKRNNNPNRVKMKYLHTPSELQEETRLQKVFAVIDEDSSNAIDIGEMRTMFLKYNINIDQQQLEQLYRLSHSDDPRVLTFKEFKSLSKSESIQRFFSVVIKQIERSGNDSLKLRYYPRSFASMISYFSYQIRREQKIREIQGDGDGPASPQLKSPQHLASARKSGAQGLLRNFDNLDQKWKSIQDLLKIQDIDDDNNNPYKVKKKVNQHLRKIVNGGTIGGPIASVRYEPHEKPLPKQQPSRLQVLDDSDSDQSLDFNLPYLVPQRMKE